MQPSPGLDPALPALPQAFSFEAVASRLEAAVEGAEGRPVTVTSASLLDVKYEPGERCTVTYGLAGKGLSRETIGVIEVDGAGVAARLFHEDAALPGLASALDAAGMRERFAALPAGRIGMASIEACAVAPVRYKPRLSCVLRYRLAGGGREAIIFGKLVAGRWRELWSALSALEALSASEATMPRIPRSVGVWPEVDLVAQLEAPGESLGAAVFDRGSPAAEGTRLMRRAGRALGALHTCAGVTAPRRTLGDDVADLRGYRTLFVRLAPELLGMFDDAVGALARFASLLPEPPPVASHGTLRADHFLVDGSDVTLIDLDGFCSANPARDVGNLLAYLDWKAIRCPHAAGLVDEAENEFLRGYGAVARLSERWLEIYRAASMLKIAGRRLRSLRFDEWRLLPELLGRARRGLAGTSV